MNSKYLLLFLFIVSLQLSYAQSSYLDKLKVKFADESHISATADGGWLVAYSIQNDVAAFLPDAIQVIKYDACQEVAWIKEYQFGGATINVDALLVHSNGDLFLTGYVEDIPDDEDLFLLKLSPEGSPLFFKIYRKPFRELVYTFEETPDGNLMIFGLSYATSNQSRNAFLTIDTQGNILQATSHGEAGIWGRGKACSDGSYIGRMGSRIFKVDAAGATVWANTYAGTSNCSAPIEVEGGYVFSSNTYVSSGETHHFLFKLGDDGNIEWVRPGYQANGFATLRVAANGNILCLDSYYDEAQSNIFEVSLIEFSPDGQQLSNRKILPTFSPLSAIGKDMNLMADGSVLFSALSGLNRDTLYIGKSDTALNFACGEIENFNEDTVKVLTITPFTMPNNAITFDVEDQQLEVTDIALVVESICKNNDIVFPPPPSDTMICAGEKVLLAIDSPGASFLWNDGSTADTLLVNASGNYEVAVTICSESKILETTVVVEDCPCNIAIPNAFTPDGDGQNESFKILYSCPVVDFALQIYNRWGELVFESSDPALGWDGLKDGQPAEMDVYMYKFRYRFEGRDVSSLLQEQGNVTLIR